MTVAPDPNRAPDDSPKARAMEFALRHTVRRHGTTTGYWAEEDYKRFYLDYLAWIEKNTSTKGKK